MAVPSVNITIEKGTNFSKDFIIKDTNGSVVDLTGYTFVARIRKYPEDTLTVQTFTVGITSAVEGLVNISMTTSITAELKNGRNYYDVVSTSTTSVTKREVEGMAIVSPTVSV